MPGCNLDFKDKIRYLPGNDPHISEPQPALAKSMMMIFPNFPSLFFVGYVMLNFLESVYGWNLLLKSHAWRKLYWVQMRQDLWDIQEIWVGICENTEKKQFPKWCDFANLMTPRTEPNPSLVNHWGKFHSQKKWFWTAYRDPQFISWVAAATGDFARVVRNTNHPTKPIQVSVVKNMHLDGKQVFLVSRVCELSD